MSERILICNSQIPFARGGAEILADSLAAELAARGHEVDHLRLPFSLASRGRLLESALAWRLLDVTAVEGRPIDRVIATRFPSYLVKHPNKVVWLVHQLRQVYDLRGTPYSDFAAGDPVDERAMAMVRAIDRRTLGEARRRFAISRNTAERLARDVGLEAEVLHPPSALAGRLRPGPAGDYVLGVGRLDPLKRFDLLVRALAHAGPAVRCRLAGDGPEAGRLAELAGRLGVAGRIDFLGRVGEADLIDLYAGALAVFYAPYDEDYGYVTAEAFEAGKPVVTCADSGGVLELVEDGVNGFVCDPGSPRAIAERIDRLHRDRALAAAMGERGRTAAAAIGWDRVIAGLLS